MDRPDYVSDDLEVIISTEAGRITGDDDKNLIDIKLYRVHDKQDAEGHFVYKQTVLMDDAGNTVDTKAPKLQHKHDEIPLAGLDAAAIEGLLAENDVVLKVWFNGRIVKKSVALELLDLYKSDITGFENHEEELRKYLLSKICKSTNLGTDSANYGTETFIKGDSHLSVGSENQMPTSPTLEDMVKQLDQNTGQIRRVNQKGFDDLGEIDSFLMGYGLPPDVYRNQTDDGIKGSARTQNDALLMAFYDKAKSSLAPTIAKYLENRVDKQRDLMNFLTKFIGYTGTDVDSKQLDLMLRSYKFLDVRSTHEAEELDDGMLSGLAEDLNISKSQYVNMITKSHSGKFTLAKTIKLVLYNTIKEKYLSDSAKRNSTAKYVKEVADNQYSAISQRKSAIESIAHS